ncbi:uncharacterized protein LOC113557273 isoform X2 [Rhopalosiphum maidis]|uniref:uncharacterized protein LOC113557273 isoform X2 n=1 Tax=Rhopalosiphum maidis TaxID=43146 RepID=UPI000EFFD567|nr:uncharacterized protein LOC113557273 isoform X2 [Rhopalosiphum maidis]
MEKKTMIYNFGPDGRDACWAALTSSWTHFPRQQGTHNSWPAKSRRLTKKKKQNVLTTVTTSLSPLPQPLPSSSPKALKRQSGTQQWSTLVNDQLSSSVEVMTQTISEPPLTNGPCNCNQSVNSEPSDVKNVTGNNNNNDDDDDDTEKNKWKHYKVVETIDVVDQKQQQLMLCVADSRSSVDIKEPTAVDAHQPIEYTLQNGGDHVSSMSHPPTLSTVTEQPIERGLQNGGDHISTEPRPPTPSTATEKPIERVLQNGSDHAPYISHSPTPSTVAEKQFERALQNGGDQILTEPRTQGPFTAIEKPIERALANIGDQVSTVSRPPTPFTVTENPAMLKVDMGYRDEVVSPASWPQLSLMTSTYDTENPIDITIVSPSSQSQPNDDEECPVQSNSSMIVLSEKPLSKYDMKIKEIDNSIISYSKSFLSTVFFVVLLRVLF